MINFKLSIKTLKSIKAYAALSAEKPLEPWHIDRREPGSDDVEIEIYLVEYAILIYIPQEMNGVTRFIRLFRGMKLLAK